MGHSLRSELHRLETLNIAWSQLRKSEQWRDNDGASFKAYEEKLIANLRATRQRLRSNEYDFDPPRAVRILKGNGAYRTLLVPTIRDRVVLKAIAILVTNRLQTVGFRHPPGVFGYVPKRSIHHAVARIATFRDQGYTHVFEADIEKFFDHIDQELLLKEYLRRTKDRSLISILRAGFPKEKTIAQEDFENQRLDRGVPQGSAVSPLLSNLYLYPFDQHMQQAGLRMVRYADDFIVLAKSDAELEDIEATVREHIESRLKLTLNKEKTKPTSFEAGFTFLGFHFSAAGQNIGKKALDAAKEKTTGFLRITHDFQLTSTATHLNSYIKGWAIAYAPVNHQSAMKELDDHLIKMVRQALITIGIIGSKQLVSKKHLSRLGITTFGYELTAARSRYEGTIERRR